ncbi:hypothetical protein OG21DRAFT_1517656 [Imleria badia]|nr:hypothetical protein OG21DRAFT_1517656 [Imleria badia]
MNLTGPQHDSGLIITPRREARDCAILLYTQLSEFNPNKLSMFAFACVCGNYDAVKEAIESGTAPDLIATQTPFQYGFLVITVLGARIRARWSDNMHRRLHILNYLIGSGAPLDTPDIFGYTALCQVYANTGYRDDEGE